MSDKTHKILTWAGGLAAVVLGVLLQSPLLAGHAQATGYVTLALSVLAALGFGVARPAIAIGDPAAAAPPAKKDGGFLLVDVGIAVGAVAMLVVFAMAMAGCAASALKDVKVAEATTAEAVTGAYQALNAYDQQKLGAISDQARADLPGARAALADYVPKRAKAAQALDDAAAILTAADELIQQAEAGSVNPKDLAAWIPRLVAAGIAVATALKALGVKLPIPTGSASPPARSAHAAFRQLTPDDFPVAQHGGGAL